ncbi:antitermination protein [Escherichia coli]|nr:antitermination protein [Escherichia coli]ELF1003410.1 antitermination protein [Shigella flexneri]EKG8972025.1 antitermination protein [Escherichia coli]EKG8976096.1 antitermination protein [Escherichia coli]ELL2693389.1 antitermination protein [Escherichia coli]
MWSSRVGNLQEVEGIIEGMLMTLDIRLGTDIVVIKSN